MNLQSYSWKNRTVSCLSIQCSVLEKVLDKKNLFVPLQGVSLKACMLGDLCTKSLLNFPLGSEKTSCYCSSFTEYLESLWSCSWKVLCSEDNLQPPNLVKYCATSHLGKGAFSKFISFH